MPLPRKKRIKRRIKNLDDSTSSFVLQEDCGSMMEITFGSPSVFGGRITFPCNQVQSSARGTLVKNDMIDFIFFFGINQVRRRLEEERTICFRLVISR